MMQRIPLVLALTPMLVFAACEQQPLTAPGVRISGKVVIPAALNPRLPPPAGGGRTVAEVEPNTVPPENTDVGAIEPDSTALLVEGSLDGATDIRDRFLFQITKAASVTVKLEVIEGGGQANIRLATGPLLLDDESNVLGLEFVGAEPANISAVVGVANAPLLISIRHIEGAFKYRLTVNAVSGTVVGKVYVGVYRADDGHPAFFPDPVRKPKLPLGSIEVTGGALDDDGNWVGTFEDLLVDLRKDAHPERADIREAGKHLQLFAWADNDGTGSSTPANLLISPPTPADFISSERPDIAAPPEDTVVEVELSIDAPVTDQDFDGVLDFDANGDGRPDDDCPTAPNPNQEDRDADGVGDACDVCPQTFDPDQANTDGVGLGDGCNDVAGEPCPLWLGVYETEDCFLDDDGDEFDDRFLVCEEGVPACFPPDEPDANDVADELVAITEAGDNCKDVANPDQADLDNDGLGDLCDGDDDGDGVADGDDVCPGVADREQEDADADGVGDECDNCAAAANPDQSNTDSVELCNRLIAECDLGDACDPDDDGDGVCDPGETPTAAGECSGADNCPVGPNPLQNDGDGDGVGDACDVCPTRTTADTDSDEDGIGDACDLCPGTAEPRLACATDADCVDAGGVCLEGGLCLTEVNADRTATTDIDCEADADCGDGSTCTAAGTCSADALPDACDADADGDGVADEDDDCLGLANADQADEDGDGVGDACDLCPKDPDDEQLDADADGVGDACDLCKLVASAPVECAFCVDDDGCTTGVCNLDTNTCVAAPAEGDDPAGGACGAAGSCTTAGVCANDLDTDGDEQGDACDADDDGDGVCDPCDPSGDGAPNLPICAGALTASGCTGADNCPADANADQVDLDRDATGDVCDVSVDDDEDTIPNPDDNCPADENEGQADIDDDGVGDACDLCVDVVDPPGADGVQADADGDAVGDACDNCAGVPNADQSDADDDGRGDACDTDADDDGVVNEDDNCRYAANGAQTDADADGFGDACDPCPGHVDQGVDDDGDGLPEIAFDLDGDGVGDACDNCPADENPAGVSGAQSDSDGDGFGDVCDVCPNADDPDQDDLDLDLAGDACDDDDDGDSVPDTNDNCPTVANLDQSNVDAAFAGGDMLGDACDDDVDADGRLNDADVCASTPNPTNLLAPIEDETGDLPNDLGSAELYTDGTGENGELAGADRLNIVGSVGDVGDDADFLTVAFAGAAGTYGQVVVSSATTGDIVLFVDGPGVIELIEGEAYDVEAGTEAVLSVVPGADATGPQAYTVLSRIGGLSDDDLDGTPDACDSCSLATNIGDSDGDDVDDVCDNCLLVPNDDQAGGVVGTACGGVDDDNDGVCNPGLAAAPAACGTAEDNCVSTANPAQDDVDEDGIGDACDDTDADGVLDDADNCRTTANPLVDHDADALTPSVQPDEDADGVGDACDNCAAIANEEQENADGDQRGDACDNCRAVPNDGQEETSDPANGVGDACDGVDPDDDLFCNDPTLGAGCGATVDNCPDVANEDQANADGAGPGDACNAAEDPDADEFEDATTDNCPGVSNPAQDDNDADLFGDACDNDDDGDGWCDDAAARDASNPGCVGVDNCPADRNPDQADTDGDDLGDVCDVSIFVPTIEEVEPNEDTPQFLGFAVVNTTMSVTGAVDQTDTDDLFAIRAPMDGTLVLSMTFTGADFDLMIPPFDDIPLVEGAQSGNPELQTVSMSAGDEVVFDVNAYEGAGTYEVAILFVADVEPADALQAIDMGAIRIGEFYPIETDYAGDLAGAPRGWITDWDGDADAADEQSDEFVITALSTGTLVIDATFAGDVDIVTWLNASPDAELAGNDQTYQGAIGDPALHAEHIELDVVAGDTVQLSVLGYDLTDGTTYSIHVVMQ